LRCRKDNERADALRQNRHSGNADSAHSKLVPSFASLDRKAAQARRPPLDEFELAVTQTGAGSGISFRAA
jgi:hypothetical protein